MKKRNPKEISGRTWLKDDVIHHESTWCGTWSLPLSKVSVIGEMTNDLGPMGEDWLLCFANSVDGEVGWHEASVYAEDCDEFLAALADRLNTTLSTTLYGSCDFNSNILWPPQLANKPMFDFVNDKPTTLLQRLKWLIGFRSNTQYFTQDVIEFIEQR